MHDPRYDILCEPMVIGPVTTQRSDKYGRRLEIRARFGHTIISDMKDAMEVVASRQEGNTVYKTLRRCPACTPRNHQTRDGLIP
ncbi:MAG: hypothetical protein ABJJ53_19830 [Sulfitobacter sp.]